MRSVLLDTNLFVLLIVGFHNRDLIGTHKRTRNFVAEDYDLLVKAIDGYEILWVTSHCLAEVSNLLKHTHSNQARALMTTFAAFVATAKESHIRKERIFSNPLLVRLGVADTGIVLKSKRVSCVYTVDFELYRELARNGNPVINFNHLRNLS